MKIKVTLQNKNFYFLDGLNLVKGQEEEIDLSIKMDPFLASIASSIALGYLKSDIAYGVVVGLIKEESYRNIMAQRLNVDLSKFKDEIKTEAVITNIEVEEVVVEEVTEVVAEVEEVVQADPNEELYSLLKGSNRSVSTKIKAATLSDEDIAMLLEAEENGKNRAVVRKLLSA